METTPTRPQLGDDLLTADQIQSTVEEVLATTQFIDVHTHLFAPEFGDMGLWGIDELLTYHYLEAELFRSSSISPERYWELSKREQADAIWQALFVENSPLSEATRGVIAVLDAFDLPTDSPDLEEARSFFRAQRIESHVLKVLQMAGVSSVVMTNDPLHPGRGAGLDEWRAFPARTSWRCCGWIEFSGAGRDTGSAWPSKAMPWTPRPAANRRPRCAGFLPTGASACTRCTWRCRLPTPSNFRKTAFRAKLLREAVLPSCREFDLPLSLMIGVRRQVNPRIRLAGDAVGKADLRALENICRDYPDNRILVSVLSRENQHELCVYARKFSNLMPFGCWWFLNNPSIVEEITRERIEMLGTSFIPQHSDARVLEQVLYKWRNTRATMSRCLGNSYRLLARDGRGSRDKISSAT